jgi:hypothetical protein
MLIHEKYIKGSVTFSDTMIPVVSEKLSFHDFLGAVKVRWGISRDKYRVAPGLYAIGTPDCSSDVFVTANYKLTFDSVRKNLCGLSGWILVLDTKGVNVWCAAGKGTFSTQELVSRIGIVSLGKVVSHRKIILPQLAATGVAAHKVKEMTGFNVHYGPVRAADIKDFIKGGYRSSKEMRLVKFDFIERLKLIPNDLMQGRKYLFIAAAAALLLSGISLRKGTFDFQFTASIKGILNVFVAYLTGVVISPALLPYIPFRMFSMKGLLAGILVSAGMFFTVLSGVTPAVKAGWLMIIPSISSFMMMNFTGSSTYTSLSGVKKEMKFSLPLQITLAVSGIILLVISWF